MKVMVRSANWDLQLVVFGRLKIATKTQNHQVSQNAQFVDLV